MKEIHTDNNEDYNPRYNDIHFENNEGNISNYIKMMELGDLKEATIEVRLYSLVPFFKYLNNKDAKEVIKKDIENYILFMRKSKKKKTTQNKDLLNLRAFFKWLKPDNDFFNNIKIKNLKPDTSKKTYVTVEDVKQMLQHCTNQRDRCLLLLLWESGARLGELLSLNVFDVKPQKYGVIVTVTGKTGTRDILIIDSVPDIQLWLNIYKPSSPNAPLFPVLDGPERLKVRGAEKVIKKLANKTKIETRIWPHGLRHGRLSELSNAGMSEMMLRHYAGWQADSDMPSRYLHVKQEDVFNKLLKIKGIKTEETEQEPVKLLSTKKCPRCNTENAFDARYCKTCSLILDQKLALEFEKETSDTEIDAIEMIRQDPELAESLAKILKGLKK